MYEIELKNKICLYNYEYSSKFMKAKLSLRLKTRDLEP